VLLVCAGLLTDRAAAVSPDTCLPPAVDTVSTQNSGAIDWSISLRPIGPLEAIMLFVDFSDRPGTASTTGIYDSRVPRAVQWLAGVSHGRMTLTVTAVHQWFRMPSPSTGYHSRSNPSFTAHRRLIQHAVAAADPTVDFSGYDLIYVVSPNGSGIDYSPAFTPNDAFFGVPADGNNFTHGATLGNDFYVNDVYGTNVLLHETGHTFGLPDLYDYARTVFPYSTFVGDWDIMGYLNVGAGFVAWQRLQLGWVELPEIACLAAPETQDVRLSPIEQAGGTQAAIVRTGATTFTVAENRQAVAEDALICDNGVLVYTVDASVESGRGSIKVQPAAPDDGTKNPVRCGVFYNAAYSVGDAPFSSGGVAIKAMCAAGSDLVVRVAAGVALGSEPSPACPPGVPTAVSATAGDGQATVSFAPPAGGAVPVLYYTVTATPGGQSASGTGSPITVQGLANGTSYTFTVTATNGPGTGPASAPSNAIVPTASEGRTILAPPPAGARADVPVFTPPSGGRPPRPGQP
jgi:M6 family metalloprotease-like protein